MFVMVFGKQNSSPSAANERELLMIVHSHVIAGPTPIRLHLVAHPGRSTDLQHLHHVRHIQPQTVHEK